MPGRTSPCTRGLRSRACTGQTRLPESSQNLPGFVSTPDRCSSSRVCRPTRQNNDLRAAPESALVQPAPAPSRQLCRLALVTKRTSISSLSMNDGKVKLSERLNEQRGHERGEPDDRGGQRNDSQLVG